MWLVRDNFFGFAWTSGPITKWGCSLQHERTFSELVRNGRHYPSPDPARFYWSCPLPNSCTLSWGVFGFTRESPPEKSLSLPIPDHIPVRPQKRNSRCLLLSRRSLEWESSVGKVSGRQRGSQTGLLSAAKLICAGESQVPEVSSIRPGAWIPHNE